MRTYYLARSTGVMYADQTYHIVIQSIQSTCHSCRTRRHSSGRRHDVSNTPTCCYLKLY